MEDEIEAFEAEEPQRDAHYHDLQLPETLPHPDSPPPKALLEDFSIPEETEAFLSTLFSPDQALVIKYARLQVSGDADKMREYAAFRIECLSRGVHHRAVALFDGLVVDRVRKHVDLAGRLIPPELSSNPYEFMRAYDLRNRPRKGWLVDEILMEDGFAVLYGPPKSGKSFVALDWALSMVHGVDWLGRPTMRGAVGYIAAEGEYGLGPRIAAWQVEHGCSEDDIEREEFYILGAAPDLMKAETAQKLAMATWTIPDLKLIVIDTMARTMVDGDENAARDVGKFIANVELLKFATGAAVLVVHHTTKADQTNVRGSSALPGAATTLLSLVEPKGTHGGLILTCDKQKENAEFDPPILLQRDTIDLGDDESSCVIRAGTSLFPQVDNRQSTLRILVETFPDGASHAEWLKEAAIPPSTFDWTIKKLRRDGYIEKGEGHQGKYTATDKAPELLNLPGMPSVDLSSPLAGGPS